MARFKNVLTGISHEALYPVFFTVYPVLFLYSHNISELTADVIWLPLLWSLVGAVLLFFVGRWLYGNWPKAAMWTFVFLVAFFGYGAVSSSLPDKLFQIKSFIVGGDKVLFPLALVLLVVYSWWWRRARFQAVKAIPVLNLVTLGLVIICGLTIIPIEVGRFSAQASTVVPGQAVGSRQAVLGTKPDVYYLVFDRYTGAEALRQNFHFDNSQALNWLKEQGFYVVDDALDNYPKTSFSLLSTFTMNFHPAYTPANGAYPTEATAIYPLFQDNPVQQLFHQAGYKTYALGSWFWPSIQPQGFDAVYQYQPLYWLKDSFQSQFLESTMAMPFIHELGEDNLADENVKHRVYLQYELANYQKVFGLPGPKFVFAHLLLPHPPYIVDKNCQPVQPPAANADPKAYYLGQLQCANQVIQDMVSNIEEVTDHKAIIIVQSDEGSGIGFGDGEIGNNLAATDDKSLLVRTNILNAFYFPDQDYSRLSPGLTSVNTFRILFDQYFGQNLPLLPNTTYAFQDQNHLFNYVDVTARLHQALDGVKVRQ